MSAELLLGLDVGTTSCKAAVVTPEGEEVAHGQAPLRWTTVPTGAEIAPAGFLECALAAAREALAAAPQGRVAALGVSSMAETGVLLDAGGTPVVASIAWHDSRGEEEAERLGEELGTIASRRTPACPCARCARSPSTAGFATTRRRRPAACAG